MTRYIVNFWLNLKLAKKVVLLLLLFGVASWLLAVNSLNNQINNSAEAALAPGTTYVEFCGGTDLEVTPGYDDVKFDFCVAPDEDCQVTITDAGDEAGGGVHREAGEYVAGVTHSSARNHHFYFDNLDGDNEQKIGDVYNYKIVCPPVESPDLEPLVETGQFTTLSAAEEIEYCDPDMDPQVEPGVDSVIFDWCTQPESTCYLYIYNTAGQLATSTADGNDSPSGDRKEHHFYFDDLFQTL